MVCKYFNLSWCFKKSTVQKKNLFKETYKVPKDERNNIGFENHNRIENNLGHPMKFHIRERERMIVATHLRIDYYKKKST